MSYGTTNLNLQAMSVKLRTIYYLSRQTLPSLSRWLEVWPKFQDFVSLRSPVSMLAFWDRDLQVPSS